MESFVLVFCITTASLAIVNYILRRIRCHQLWKNLGIPGPKPSLWTGNFYELRSERKSHLVMNKWIDKYGDVVGYYMGPRPCLVISNVDIIKKILVQDFDIFSSRESLVEYKTYPYMHAIVSLINPRWKEVRSRIAYCFSAVNMRSASKGVLQKLDVMTDILTEKAKTKEPFELHRIAHAFALDVSFSAIFSENLQTLLDCENKLAISIKQYLRIALNPVAEIPTFFPFMTPVFAKIVILFDQLHIVHNYVLCHITKVINTRLRKPIETNDFLQIMLKDFETDANKNRKKELLTRDEIIANSFILLLAGYDTTASSITFLFYLLAMNPEVQNKLYGVIAELPEITYENVRGLKYLNQVIKETLRLYPPTVEFITRKCLQDYQVGRYTIPKNTSISVPLWHLHRSPKHWENPEKFDPDRFASAETFSAYMPFGSGKRMCLGKRFGESTLRITVCKLLKKFRFLTCAKTSVPDIRIGVSTTPKAIGGVYLKVEER